MTHRLILAGLMLAAVADAQTSSAQAISDKIALDRVKLAIKKHDPDPILVPMTVEDDPTFSYFEEMNPNPNTSAHVAYLAVNRMTGAVWAVAGVVCEPLLPPLHEMARAGNPHPSLCGPLGR